MFYTNTATYNENVDKYLQFSFSAIGRNIHYMIDKDDYFTDNLIDKVLINVHIIVTSMVMNIHSYCT